MAARATAWAAVLALTGVLAASPALASAKPGLEATVGGTTTISGVPNEGGFSVSLSPMWELEDRFSFGVMLAADDMGTRIGTLRDPNDGVDLGSVSVGHSYVLGAAWRFDHEWGSLNTWLPYASGTWGYYRIIDDVRGSVKHRAGSTGFSLGAGVRRAVNGDNAVGASVRYHRLFNDRIGRYVAWAVDWSFR